MNNTIMISKKPEIYTFDELEFISTILSQNEIKQKIITLKNQIESNKTNQSIFFMPEETYNIFSLFQKQPELPQITYSDCEYILTALKSTDINNLNIINHIVNKITTLKQFLEANKIVYSTISQSDNLTYL